MTWINGRTFESDTETSILIVNRNLIIYYVALCIENFDDSAVKRLSWRVIKGTLIKKGKKSPFGNNVVSNVNNEGSKNKHTTRDKDLESIRLKKKWCNFSLSLRLNSTSFVAGCKQRKGKGI